MQQIIYFFTKNSTKLLFLLLLVISLYLTIQSHAFHKSQFINSANMVSGIIYEETNSLKEYLHLKSENEMLAIENVKLKQILYNNQLVIDSAFTVKPELRIPMEYKVFQTKIVRNIYNKKENYLTIKGGSKNGFAKDMGVLNTRGVIGIVENVSNNYATVQSILNSKTRIDAKVQNSNHFGTIVWDGKNAGYVQLIDVPKLAKLHKGDSIVTGGESTIFPENIPIGVIDKVFASKTSNFYTISVRLFNDMTNISSIYLIENVNLQEIKQLEAATLNNE